MQQMNIRLSNGITISYDWTTTPLEDLPEQAAFFIDQVKEVEKDCTLLIIQNEIEQSKKEILNLEKEVKRLKMKKDELLKELDGILTEGTRLTLNYLKDLGLKQSFIEEIENKLENTQTKIRRTTYEYNGEF